MATQASHNPKAKQSPTAIGYSWKQKRLLRRQPTKARTICKCSYQSKKSAHQSGAVYEISENADLTVSVHQKCPYCHNGDQIAEQTFKIDREILVSASPMFKAMLSGGKFLEGRKSEITLVEDTGATCQALDVLFTTLFSKHEFQSTSCHDLEKLHTDGKILYKMTPLHVMEILELAYLWGSECPQCYGRTGKFRQGTIVQEDLHWWLNQFPRETRDGVRALLPFRSISVTTAQLASSLRLLEGCIALMCPDHEYGQGRHSPGMEAILLLEKDLAESDEPQTSTESHLVNRLQLFHYARQSFSGMAYGSDKEVDQELVEDFILERDKGFETQFPKINYDGKKEPSPATELFLTIDDLQNIIFGISRGNCCATFDAWDVTQHLIEMDYPREGVPNRASFHREIETITKNTSRLAGVNVLIPLLIALDKYLIPFSTMSTWFKMWFDKSWDKLQNQVRPKTLKGKTDCVKRLMAVAHAAYKFDNAFAFNEVTEFLDHMCFPLRRPFERLVERHPRLHCVVLLDDRLMEGLGRREIHQIPQYRQDGAGAGDFSLDGLCLDCFNASVITITGAPKTIDIPTEVEHWAKANILSLVSRMTDADPSEVDHQWADPYNMFLAPNTTSAGLAEITAKACIFGCRGKKERHINIWKRSWTPGVPRPTSVEHQCNILSVARSLGWEEFASVPQWLRDRQLFASSNQWDDRQEALWDGWVGGG
ncbi:hypothetical protein F5Y16DRAFT_414813 [Xylariaceae sp. FL0255]|nr:hypothetical protein F5Y16DRAFT_414813 [Xylariaceae sp. FL0255]